VVKQKTLIDVKSNLTSNAQHSQTVTQRADAP